jgi:hypothetical protein
VTSSFEPPFTPLAYVDATLRERGEVVVRSSDLHAALDAPPAALNAWQGHWHHLAPDTHLKDGGKYRQRRHGSVVMKGGAVHTVTHRAHWQPVEYNALHGGIERWFEPLAPAMTAESLWPALLAWLAACADALRGAQPWYTEVHPFRISTTEGGIGRPTPEGAHRDGVDLVAVFLVARHNVKGGETRVFEAAGPHGLRFTLTEPWTVLLLDDARVIHETTPIQPQTPGEAAYRDTLVVTLRAKGFQGPPPAS